MSLTNLMSRTRDGQQPESQPSISKRNEGVAKVVQVIGSEVGTKVLVTGTRRTLDRLRKGGQGRCLLWDTSSSLVEAMGHYWTLPWPVLHSN